MKNVRFDSSKAAAFLPEQALTSMEAAVTAARKTLLEKTGAGNDFLGWIDLPVDYDKEEFARIQKAAEKIREGFGSAACHRNRRFLSGSKSGD